jgi:rubrerythrin
MPPEWSLEAVAFAIGRGRSVKALNLSVDRYPANHCSSTGERGEERWHRNQSSSDFEANLSDERDSAALYETLADAEHDVERKQVYTELAASERDHAQVWSERLRKMG